MIKRLFDIIVSLLGIIMFLPILLCVSFLIKHENGEGTIFYRGVRIGKNGKPFKIFKFRTMVMNAETIGGSSTADDDLRLSKIGKFLRKYKVDELPQLVNVFKGDMSLIGPRPQVLWAVKFYSNEDKKILLSVRPGITDYASIKFNDEGGILKGSKDPDKDYMEKIHPEKIRLSKKYVKNISFKTDLEILFRTFLVIVKKGD